MQGREVILMYRLYESCDGRYADGRSYSLSVDMTDPESDLYEFVYLEDISGDSQTALEIFEYVSNGVVTPITADEIFSDFWGL